jgi:hypothetical protein
MKNVQKAEKRAKVDTLQETFFHFLGVRRAKSRAASRLVRTVAGDSQN